MNDFSQNEIGILNKLGFSFDLDSYGNGLATLTIGSDIYLIKKENGKFYASYRNSEIEESISDTFLVLNDAIVFLDP